MLKRLELVGFKSFAEKTRIDFTPGITGVVGPNGSGKSNVVDAVRWILGEQSAKSLRGGEMADVIFNGSSSRKSLGMAEVTVTFDNMRRLLTLDADEVQLTRRVYRDGTGEYLINGQMARLRDFKDMFLGSGAGAGGYTIIAQGRVDELLQSSTKDRREIFDEAAGISRFKARKRETLQKLATVELNLTRSQDRLGSLETQLRTLRMQAAKAQKHQEYSNRLRDLRVGFGLREYRELTTAFEAEQHVLQELQSEVAGVNRQTGELEKALRELDRELTRSEGGLRHQEGRLADARQQIATYDANWKHERSSSAEYQAELLKLGRLVAELGFRTKSLEADAKRAATEGETLAERLAAEQHAADSATEALTRAHEHVTELDREAGTLRENQFELVGQAAAARSTATASLEQVERLQKEYTRKRGDIEQNTARRTTLAEALDRQSRADADLQVRMSATRERLAQFHQTRDELAERVGEVQTALEGLRVQQGDLRGRIEILENLERSLDGLGAGVRVVLEQLQRAHLAGETPFPVFSQIIGLVADLLTVPHDMASLVELALGDATQRFVVRSPDAVNAVAIAITDAPGRVGLIPLNSVLPPNSGTVLPRTLAAVVSSEEPALPEQLLGNVLLADTFAAARQLQTQFPTARIVARTGELLEPDGTVIVGSPNAEAGLVSRKSELRELREQSGLLAQRVTATERQLVELRREADTTDGSIEAVESELELLSGEVGDLQQTIARQRQQVEQLDEMVELLQSEAGFLESEVQRGEAAWVNAKHQAEQAEHAAVELRERLTALQDQLRTAEQTRETAQQAHTAAQVSLSRATAERDRIRERQTQLEGELRKRRVEALDLSAADRTTRNKLHESTLAQLRASAAQAEAYREKEHRERLAGELAAKATADRLARESTQEQLHALRTGWQVRQAQAHEKELAVHDLQSKRDAIADRLREDYGIELAQLTLEPQTLPESLAADPAPDEPITVTEAEPSAEPSVEVIAEPEATLTPAEVQSEIEELKRKIARLGSVNMEALEELVRVESEFTNLRTQHDDLNAARKSLQDVIDAINTDSRKLFIDTLAAVRGYFQELFRKLFGGGQADIVLEDEADVLESGIEITARPPGKELRSLSLLSGGEKTLTAVALLLAIFRNKPSPFSILDEVDAALDEANTTRLAGVLREFLDQSQFIVVTHKKRTMAAADRLWGVTMQESGVTRLLPMRFEDWPDEPAESEQVA